MVTEWFFLTCSWKFIRSNQEFCNIIQIRPNLHERGAIVRAVYHVGEWCFISTWFKHPIVIAQVGFDWLNLSIVLWPGFITIKLRSKCKRRWKAVPNLYSVLSLVTLDSFSGFFCSISYVSPVFTKRKRFERGFKKKVKQIKLCEPLSATLQSTNVEVKSGQQFASTYNVYCSYLFKKQVKKLPESRWVTYKTAN